MVVAAGTPAQKLGFYAKFLVLLATSNRVASHYGVTLHWRKRFSTGFRFVMNGPNSRSLARPAR